MKRAMLIAVKVAASAIAGYIIGALLCVAAASTWLLKNGYLSKTQRLKRTQVTTRYP
jgi:hypothetical protein